MIFHATTHKIIGMILKQAERRSFVPLVGITSFVSTLSMSVPVEWLVVVATLACRTRWMATASAAALGSSVASLGLYLAFHHFGWYILLERYPELAGSRAWLHATGWLSSYGLLAIFGLMALPLPIPKLPMLAVAGICRLRIPDVFIAILAGKIIKYLVYAYIAVRFPKALRSLTDHGVSLIGLHASRHRAHIVAGMATRHTTRTWFQAKVQKHILGNGESNVG